MRNLSKENVVFSCSCSQPHKNTDPTLDNLLRVKTGMGSPGEPGGVLGTPNLEEFYTLNRSEAVHPALPPTSQAWQTRKISYRF